MIQKAVVPADSRWAEKDIADFRGQPVSRIRDEWMLITAGNTNAEAGNWNTMTASWGGLGELWSKDVAFMFIRPSRHTRAFADSNSLFTLSFFDQRSQKALALCGEKSGRDCDKAEEAGLTPVVFDERLAGGRIAGAVSFAEATQIIVCRKIYTHDFDPGNFLDPSIEKNYSGKDYHRMYVGEILALLEAR